MDEKITENKETKTENIEAPNNLAEKKVDKRTLLKEYFDKKDAENGEVIIAEDNNQVTQNENIEPVVESSQKNDEQKKPKKWAKFASITASVFIVIFTAFLVMLMITTNVYRSATVVGSSMYPTINAKADGNDGAFYTLYKNANINDIIIVDYDSSGIASNIDAIKRLIAKGGDTICFYGGKILKNNKPIDDWYIQSAINYMNQTGEDGTEWAENGYQQCKNEFVNFCTQVLNGFSSINTTFVQTCKSDEDFKEEHIRYDSALHTYVLTVPENYIFFLGDNRGGSTDCSDFGPLEEKYLLAKVDFVLKYNSNVLDKIFQQFIHVFA